MKKKELEPIKDKYLYQRYKGRITKYIIREDFECYIEASTGFTINIKSTFRGKTSENIIDLIEVGDIVNGYKILAITRPKEDEIIACLFKDSEQMICETFNKNNIKTILTHEQYSKNSYEVEE